MGVAGSGKTTVARKILRRVSAVYLDNNHVADAFYPDTRNGSAYNRLRPSVYRALYTLAEENLKIGNSVLLDVPHVKEVQQPKWRAFVKALAKRTRAKLVVIRCRCSEEELRNRILKRGEQRDEWKLKHWREFLANEPIDVPIGFPHLDLNTETGLSSNVRTAIRYLWNERQRAWAR